MMLFFSDLAKICLELKRELQTQSDVNRQHQLYALIPFPEMAQVPEDDRWEVYAQCCVIFSVHAKIRTNQEASRVTIFLDSFWIALQNLPKTRFSEIKNELVKIIEVALDQGIIQRDDLKTEPAFLEKVYTEFIRSYNKTQQKAHGIVYTPDYVIEFMMRFAHSRIQTHFDLPQGLASPELILYDPAMGSLSFELGLQKIVKDPEWIGRQFPTQFYGNELNAAAYFIGRFLFADASASPQTTTDKKLQVVFGSALTPDFYQSIANSPKAKNKPLIIFGNPPYAVSSANKDAWIYKLMKAYAVTEPNLTRLYDDYVKFIRYGHWLLEKHTHGILMFITNRKYLDGKIFYGMRQALLKTMAEIYIIDLFGDVRNVKGTTTGGNVFGIQTGVAISVFIKKKKKQKGQQLATVHYLGLKESASTLKQVLTKPISHLSFTSVTPRTPKFLFVPIVLEEKYQHIWATHCLSFPDCFKKTSRAMISSRDRFMIHVDRDPLTDNITLLEQREYKILRKKGRIKENYDQLLENDQILAKFDYDDMRSSITPVNYRPFDFRHTIFYTINKRCGKSIILDHLNQSPLHIPSLPSLGDPWETIGSTLAFNFVQSMQKPPFSHILVTRGIVDSGLFGYSTSKVAPIWIDGAINLSDEYITRMRHVLPSITDEQMVGYVYGMLNCYHFTTIFEPLLFHEFPRVYISEDPEVIQRIAELGMQLVNLHILNFSEKHYHLYTKFQEVVFDSVPIEFKLKKWNFSKGIITLITIPENNPMKENMLWKIQCSSQTWQYRIGSIQIIDHWLKARRFRHLNRSLNVQDWKEFGLLLFVIQKTIQIQPQIDEVFQRVFNHWNSLKPH